VPTRESGFEKRRNLFMRFDSLEEFLGFVGLVDPLRESVPDFPSSSNLVSCASVRECLVARAASSAIRTLAGMRDLTVRVSITTGGRILSRPCRHFFS
jgi:hypothetical protein